MGQQNFGPQHIIYLVVSFALIFFFWWLCAKKLKTQEARDKYIRISAICLIPFIALNRYLIHYYLARPFMPQSWCAVTGLLFALCLIFEKKDGYLLQYFAPAAVLSGFFPTFFGDYLNEGYTFGWDTLFFPPTFTSLIYHSFMFYLGVQCFMFGYVHIDIKKIYMVPIGYGVEILYGLIYLHFYPDGYTDALGKTLNVMNINKPALLFFDAKVIFVLVLIVAAIGYPLYEYLRKRITSK